MVLALRCPTGVPEPLCTMYRDGVAVCDSIRAYDEEREGEKGEVCINCQCSSLDSHPSVVWVQQFEITDWITCEPGDEITVDKMVLLARLDQTYEVPFYILFLS
jgi:hypothetical protein